jgi:hypothetical protein
MSFKFITRSRASTSTSGGGWIEKGVQVIRMTWAGSPHQRSERSHLASRPKKEDLAGFCRPVRVGPLAPDECIGESIPDELRRYRGRIDLSSSGGREVFYFYTCDRAAGGILSSSLEFYDHTRIAKSL